VLLLLISGFRQVLNIVCVLLGISPASRHWGYTQKNAYNGVAPTYQLSKHLTGLLSHHIGNSTHHVKTSIQFIQTLESLQVKPDDLMASFTVMSLFTKVLIQNSLELLSHHFEEDVLALFNTY
jgi:hypothetical protein